MKRNLFFLLCIQFISCNSQTLTQQPTYKQTKIPLNNLTGIPFQYEQNSHIIDGFEVDTRGNFYFMAGKLDWHKATLVAYSGTKLKYRKEYKEFRPSKLYIYKDHMFVLDQKYIGAENSLFVIDTIGNVVTTYQQIIKNRINTIEYVDTTIIAEIFDSKEQIDMKTQMGFIAFDFSGKMIKQVTNRFNLPDSLSQKSNSTQYLGRWKDYYLFWDYDSKSDDAYVFWLLSKEGEKIAEVTFNDKFLGKSFYGNPNETRKLRNETIFILGVEGKSALITELPLKDLFKEVE